MRSLFILLLVSTQALAQQEVLDSLQSQFAHVKSDQERVDILNEMSHAYSQLSLEIAERLGKEALDLAREIDYEPGIASGYNTLGICAAIRGEYTVGLEFFIKALEIREKLNDISGVSRVYNNISRLFIYQENYSKAIEYSQKSLEILEKIVDPKSTGNANIALGEIYMYQNKFDQAYDRFEAAQAIFRDAGLPAYESGAAVKGVKALVGQGKNKQALEEGLSISRSPALKADLFSAIELYEAIGVIYSNFGDLNLAESYLRKALTAADEGGDSNGRLASRLRLSQMFRKFGKQDSAWYYNDQYIALRNEVLNAEKSHQLAALEQLYQSERKDHLLEISDQRIRSQSIIIVVITILLLVTVVLGIFLFRFYRLKKNSLAKLESLNRDIYEKHEEILAQAEELTQANEEIRRINESLEAEVTLRVAEVKKQNQTLIEYAYFNAHNVRGPLARILGLCTLMSTETSMINLKEYNSHLNTSAVELDNVIREINMKLST